MASVLRSVFVGTSLPLLLACGGSHAPAPAKTAPPPPPAPLAVVAPAPDLSPVAAPADLVALGRFVRPASVANTFAGWVGLPFDSKVVDALEPGLSEAIALDAPIEFAVVLPPGSVADVVPNFVVTFGVASTDKAKTLLENYNGGALKEQSPGVWISGDEARAHCAVAASLGKTTARLVCSENNGALRELLPYATRGLPMEDLGSADLRAEFRIQALQKRYGAMAHMGKTMAIPTFLKSIALDDPKFDKPMADVTYAVGDELLDWFQDLDRVTFEMTAQNKPDQVTAKVTVSHKSHQSLIATAALSAQSRMVAPGPLFFDLPATATHAEYFAPTDPKLIERPRKLTNALVDGFLSHLEVNAGLRREVSTALEGVLSVGHGAVLGQVPVALPTKANPSEAEMMNSIIGCHIVGIDGPAAPYLLAQKTWVKLDSDRAYKKGLERVLRNKLEADADLSSKGSSQKAKAAPRKPYSELVTFKSKLVKGMPVPSEVTLLTFEAKATEEIVRETQQKLHRKGKLPRTKLTTLSLYLAVVPDGARTWVLVTADEKTLVEQAKALVVGSTAPRLSTRSDLAPLRGKSAYRAGFWTLLELKEWLGFALHVKEKQPKEAETLYSTLPNRGSTPIFFQSVVGGDAQHPTLESSFVLPRAVFDDVAASLPVLMMTF